MGGRNLYVLAGGGSGGHLCPGLAVAGALREADAQGEVVFLHTERAIDETILAGAEYRHEAQAIRPMPRPWDVRAVADFVGRWRATVRQCEGVLAQAQAAGQRVGVLGLGGYASGAMMRVAAKRGEAVVAAVAMLNPDAWPGKANRWAAGYAQRIFLQWEAARSAFGRHGGKCVVAGCPVRPGFAAAESEVDVAAAREAMGLAPDREVLVVLGGSQGGRNVNEAMAVVAGEGKVPARWQVWHQAGRGDRERVEEAYKQAAVAAKVVEFEPRMEVVLRGASLVVARAGASSLAELTAVGVGAILLPYPYHRDGHQRKNAQVLERAGAAVVVTDTCEARPTAARLGEVLARCAGEEKRKTMATAARRLGRADAATQVARELMDMTICQGRR